MSTKLGKDGLLKIGTAGSTPATEVKKVKDVTINVNRAMIDVTTRGSGGWKEDAPGLKTGAVEFTLVAVSSADANYTVNKTILDAFDAGTVISAMADDGGGKGMMGDFYVTDVSESQPLEDATTYSVKLSPCCDTRAPVITR